MRMIELDAIDRAILSNLQSDGKLSNVQLAAAVGLSESACLRRVKLLEESELIAGYVILLNQEKTAKPDNVFIQVTLESQQQDVLEAFEKAVQKVPEIMECYLMSGDQDYMLRVVVRDARDYERIHTYHLTNLPGVARVKSNFALRTVKKTTRLPLEGT